MEYYEFNGNWSDEMKLRCFPKLNSDKFFGYESRSSHKDILANNKIPISITDERTIYPEPTIEQFNAINFILNNEEKIFESVYRNLKDIIIPVEMKNFDLDNEDKGSIEYKFPALNSIDDLGEILGMNSIRIDIEY